jgi:hypothetical protein
VTKTKKTEEPATGTAVTAYDYGAAAGDGMGDVQNVRPEVPFINLLQSLSPEVQDGDEKQVQGARPGQFLNSLTRELSTALDCVLASVKLVYNEWSPRSAGGGFVCTHDPESAIVAEAKAAAKKTKKPWELKAENGNDIVETYVAFLVLTINGEPISPAIMTFTKTKIRRLQQAMARMASFRGAKDVPIYAHGLSLRATREKNKAGQTYFNVELAPAQGTVSASLLPPKVGDDENPVLVAGRILREAVKNGDVGANFSAASEESGKSETQDAAF